MIAAIAGVPNPMQTEIVKAWIALRAKVDPSLDLIADIQAFLTSRLAAHDYPGAVEFVSKLPMPPTGDYP